MGQGHQGRLAAVPDGSFAWWGCWGCFARGLLWLRVVEACHDLAAVKERLCCPFRACCGSVLAAAASGAWFSVPC